jgi:hypothetical protein
MALLALVARHGVVSFPHAACEQAVSHLQTARTILVPCGRRMILVGLFGGGEGNIRA